MEISQILALCRSAPATEQIEEDTHTHTLTHRQRDTMTLLSLLDNDEESLYPIAKLQLVSKGVRKEPFVRKARRDDTYSLQICCRFLHCLFFCETEPRLNGGPGR